MLPWLGCTIRVMLPDWGDPFWHVALTGMHYSCNVTWLRGPILSCGPDWDALFMSCYLIEGTHSVMLPWLGCTIHVMLPDWGGCRVPPYTWGSRWELIGWLLSARCNSRGPRSLSPQSQTQRCPGIKSAMLVLFLYRKSIIINAFNAYLPLKYFLQTRASPDIWAV